MIRARPERVAQSESVLAWCQQQADAKGIMIPGRSKLERDLALLALVYFEGPWVVVADQPTREKGPYTFEVGVSPRLPLGPYTLGDVRRSERLILISIWGERRPSGRSPVWQLQLAKSSNHPDPIRWAGEAIRDGLAALAGLPDAPDAPDASISVNT